MLYPIELLRHSANAPDGVSGTASMLTVSLCFVMSSLSFRLVVRRRATRGSISIMQIAMRQSDIIANCNPTSLKLTANSLIYIDFM
jgi:hypothetical protein